MEIELKLVRTLLLFQNKDTCTTLSNLNYYKFRFLTNFYILCFALFLYKLPAFNIVIKLFVKTIFKLIFNNYNFNFVTIHNIIYSILSIFYVPILKGMDTHNNIN